MDAYEAKLEAARNIITEFNQNSDDKIEFEKFVADLKKIGGVTDKALSLINWEELQKANLPLLTAKQIAEVFRKKDSKSPKPLSEKKVQVLNHRELLPYYDPQGFASPVAERLLKLSKGQPCIVFTDKGEINLEASLICLDDIVMGHPARPIYVGQDGIPQKVFKVGERPDTSVKENPLLPGEALRGSDEQCSKTFRSWLKISHKTRVLLRLALETRELVIDQMGRIHDILDLLINKTEDEAVQTVSQRFPRAALLYRERETVGNLPLLKLVRNSVATPKQDPFFDGHKTY